MGLCQLVWRRVLLEELNDSYGLLEVIISSWTEPFIDEVIESYSKEANWRIVDDYNDFFIPNIYL